MKNNAKIWIRWRYAPNCAGSQILPDAQSGEIPDEHKEPGDPLPLCDYLLPSEKRLDRSVVEVFLTGDRINGIILLVQKDRALCLCHFSQSNEIEHDDVIQSNVN